MANNNTIILICLIILASYFFLFYKKEELTNLNPKEQAFVDNLYDFIMNNDVSFEEYLKYLNAVKNTNLKIIDNEIFVSFKLAKKKGTFTKQSILDEM